MALIFLLHSTHSHTSLFFSIVLFCQWRCENLKLSLSCRPYACLIHWFTQLRGVCVEGTKPHRIISRPNWLQKAKQPNDLLFFILLHFTSNKMYVLRFIHIIMKSTVFWLLSTSTHGSFIDLSQQKQNLVLDNRNLFPTPHFVFSIFTWRQFRQC